MSITKIKVLIVDDEPLARDYIRRLLQSDAEIEIVGERGDGGSAYKFIVENKPDLIFLDVQMPETDGFALLKKLGAENLPPVIFTTAFEEYAIRAFEFHALDYLLKPFDERRFAQAVAFAKERLQDADGGGGGGGGGGERAAQENLQIGEMLKSVEDAPKFLERLLIKQNGRIIFLRTSEINLIKADDKYVQIYTGGKQSHLVRQTLNAMRTQLDPRLFVQIHRSAIVNIEKIKELEPMFNGDYTVVMESGAKIPVSRSFKDDLFDVLGKPL